MKLLKCNICGNKFPDNELIRTSKTRKLCQRCHIDAEEYKTLIANLCNLYGVDRPEGLWVSKIKTYKEEGMSYNQIWCVMDYIVRILGKKPDEFTIMAIPSYYNSTKKLYESKWRFDTSLEKLPKTLTIQKIKVDKSNIIKPNLNKTRHYNLEEV